MASTSFSWLHLTDLHFGLKGQDCLWPNLRQPFLDDLTELHKATGPWQAVLFTGDLVQQGKSAEFAEMQKAVLDRLWQKLAELGSGDAVLLAVPGNHDLYRPDPKADNAAVDTLLEPGEFQRIAAKFWDKPAGPYRTVVKEAFAAYTEWWQATPKRAPDIAHGIIPGDFACTLPCGEQRIGIIGLNTAFLQLGGGDYHGKLVWDVRQLQAVCGGATDDWLRQHDVCLLLTHQGPDWLTPEARQHGESEIAPAGRFGAHLYGHMHETKLQYIQHGGNPDAVRLLQGCSVFGMEKYGEPPELMRTHGYTAGKITFEDGQATLRIWPRIATNKTGPWRFIPDYENVHLEADFGSYPCELKHRSKTMHSQSDATAPMQSPPKQDKPIENPGTPHSTLPTRRPFFGRKEELAAIAKFLQPDFAGWGVVLDGPGGMGKTALALQAAHLAPTEYFPLKIFVSAKQTRLDPDGEHTLHDNRADDYFELLTQIGLALGRNEINCTQPEKRAELVRHALASQKVLLVLDNLESFSSLERRRVYDLLELLPSGCRAIVTSRRRDETAARTLRLDKIDFDAAQQLLAELGQLSSSVAKLNTHEQRTLYEETGGNPLLLTWVAAQLGRSQGRSYSVADAVARLHQAHTQHQINHKNDPLEFVFGDLLDTFTETETAILAALALFSQPAKLPWLLPLADVSEMVAQTALDDLRNRALLIEDDATGTWFLPPLCGHFLRLRRPKAISACSKNLAHHAYALSQQYGGWKNAPYEDLEKAWPQIEAAIPLFVEGDNAHLQEMCAALDKFLNYSGRWNIWLELAQAGEAKALAAKDYDNAGWRAYRIGWVHYLQGDVLPLFEATIRCTEHWQRVAAGTLQQAFAIRLKGLWSRLSKDYPNAIAAFQTAVELLRTIATDSTEVANCLINMGGAKKDSGDLTGAERDYREALYIANKIGDREGVAAYTCKLAALALKRQDWDTAKSLSIQALELARAIRRLDKIGDNHHHLAIALHMQRSSREAIPHALQAVTIFTQLRSPNLAEATATLTACEQAAKQP
ncbi:MAG: hypothetical protein RL748_3307 [Pseudomonadota bacterium]|jgi:tetratricopeptide (TPR) repeat protein